MGVEKKRFRVPLKTSRDEVFEEAREEDLNATPSVTDARCYYKAMRRGDTNTNNYILIILLLLLLFDFLLEVRAFPSAVGIPRAGFAAVPRRESSSISVPICRNNCIAITIF